MRYPWGNNRRFHSWTDEIRTRYGTRLQKVSVNAGFGCPNRDGSKGVGGCTFCNNKGFSPSYCDPEKPVGQQIDEGLSFLRRRYPRAGVFVAYLQTYSNTHAPVSKLMQVYEAALAHPAISGLVIGTRPDCVDEEKLNYLAGLAEKHFIHVEYGIESCNDRTLERVNRGHSFADSRRAIFLTAERGILTGAHMIAGLPGESREMMLSHADRINDLPLNSLKLHQLQIVRGTAMAEEYNDHPERFDLFSLEEYIGFVVDFLERLHPGIAIDRFSGEVPPQFILGRRWGNVRSDAVARLIEQCLEEKGAYQGRLYR